MRAVIMLAAFIGWELHTEHPMLNISFFQNARFTAASMSVTLVFFALFGSLFFLTQYLQFVLGYTALQAGVRVAPIALAIMIAAPTSGRLVARLGNKVMVFVGMTIVAAGLFLLSRAPGEIGTHLALTGLPVGGADAVSAGLADALVASADISRIIARLAAGESLDAGVGNTSAVGDLGAQRDWIDSCYAGNDPVTILRALRGHPTPGAQQGADVLASRSPLAVSTALEAIRRAGRMNTLAQVLEQDLMLGGGLADSADFVEGVRALLVDRDNAPRWSHRSLEDVDAAEVALLFTGGRHWAVATAG